MEKEYNLSLFNSKIKWGVQLTLPLSLTAVEGEDGDLVRIKGFVGKSEENEYYKGQIVTLHLVNTDSGTIKEVLEYPDSTYPYKLSLPNPKGLVTDIEQEGRELFEDMIEDITFIPFDNKRELMQWVMNEVYDKTRS